MRTPLHPPVAVASPDLRLARPRVRPWVLALVRLLGPAYSRLALGFSGCDLLGGARAVRAYRDFFEGKTRLLVAFRHPYGDEPQLVAWALLGLLPREARRLGTPLPRASHAIFVHGYEVPRWGGPLVRWILPRVGAVPVRHERLDAAGMAAIRAALRDGAWPLSLAPEGQTSYASERLPRIEGGTARLAFWCAAELEREGRPERVEILPVSVHHRYPPRARLSLKALILDLERRLGLPERGDATAAALAAIRDRLLDLGESLYPHARAPGPGQSASTESADKAAVPDSDPAARIAALAHAGVETAERMLGIGHGAGDDIDRMYRIRGACWKAIYREDWSDGAPTAPLELALADRRAGEAWYAMRHMETCDLAWYLEAGPPPDGAPFHLFVEYAQNLYDLCNRLSGGAISGRRTVRPRRAVLAFGEPLELRSKLPDFKADRRAASDRATAELASAYLACIKEVRDGYDRRDDR